MVGRFFSGILRETRGMHEAAYLLALFALLSQLLALLRDRLLAGTFGAGHTLDLYYAAFRIPDLLFATVASLLSLYALLPIISRLETEHPGLVISFLRKTLVSFFAAMAAVALLAFIFAPAFLAYAMPGLAGNSAAILLTRILLLQPILLGASNILANLTQLRHRFLLYSISPLLYNLGIIAGVVFFYPLCGIAGLGWGVVLGALLHVLVQTPFFFGEGRGEPLSWRRYFPMLYQVLLLSVPRTLSLSASQIALFVIVGLASLLSTGSIAVFMLAWNLQAVPLTIIGVSYSVAAFPTLSRLFSAGKTGEFAEHISSALRHILFWSLPATALVIVLRAHIVRAILGAGAFDWGATRLTAAALALFILSLAAQSVTLLIMRAYYAAGETRIPFYRGIIDIIVSVGAAVAFVALFQSNMFVHEFVEALLRVDDVPGTTMLMLALGYTVGAFAQCLIGLSLFLRTFAVPTKPLIRVLFQSFAASVIGAALAYQALRLFPPVVNTTALGILFQGFVAGVVGLVSCGIVLGLLKSEELMEVIGALKRRFVDTRGIVVEPTDISSVQ